MAALRALSKVMDLSPPRDILEMRKREKILGNSSSVRFFALYDIFNSSNNSRIGSVALQKPTEWIDSFLYWEALELANLGSFLQPTEWIDSFLYCAALQLARIVPWQKPTE
jgi:hypothetical protein